MATCPSCNGKGTVYSRGNAKDSAGGWSRCSTCGGGGRVSISVKTHSCSSCSGRGVIVGEVAGPHGMRTVKRTCSSCGGKGSIRTRYASQV